MTLSLLINIMLPG